MRTALLSLFLLPFYVVAQNVSLKSNLRILALGDSYTIGQSVAVNERWPEQLSDSLFADLEIVTDTLRIIATTGWRTDDLLNAIKGQDLEKQNYNLVSLLIGVNNQYQGKPFSQYITEFPALLDSAIRYAGGEKGHVFVVSIPDYAYTPFGQQSPNPSLISAQIDQYNTYNKHIADSAGVTYVDITKISREGVIKPSYVAADGLHPSGVQYALWVGEMLKKMHKEVQTGLTTEDKIKQSIVLYPNPAEGSFTLGAPEKSFVRIYNAQGSLVFEKTILQNSSKVDCKGFARGLYTVSILSGTVTSVKRLVIH